MKNDLRPPTKIFRNLGRQLLPKYPSTYSDLRWLLISGFVTLNIVVTLSCLYFLPYLWKNMKINQSRVIPTVNLFTRLLNTSLNLLIVTWTGSNAIADRIYFNGGAKNLSKSVTGFLFRSHKFVSLISFNAYLQMDE